jgi:hypothetical protein
MVASRVSRTVLFLGAYCPALSQGGYVAKALTHWEPSYCTEFLKPGKQAKDKVILPWLAEQRIEWTHKILAFFFFKVFLLTHNSLHREFHCDSSIYTCNVPWLGSLPPLLSLFPLPPFKMTLRDFNVLCSYMCRKYINHTHLPLPSSFSLPSLQYPPLNTICFTLLSFIVLVSAHYLVRFCLGILPENDNANVNVL